MSQRLFQGRTNNHLTFMMVDATDFASPESALSAAIKIKIYGKLQGATGVNFVSSGTGSLTNDIQHVGASALGIYTIALAKADLSDASAAWYDQYTVSLSATGAAYQTLVCEGVLTGRNVSNISGMISDVQSYLAAMSGAISDVDSALSSQFAATSDALSNNYSAVLLTQSLASDAASAAAQGNSRILLGLSAISDIDSALTSQFALTSDAISNVYSATLLTQSFASDAASAAQQANSRVLLGNSMISDVDSALSSQFTAMSALVSDTHSMAALAASHASDVYSALTAARGEPAQGAPGVSISHLAKLDYLYKAWRNKTEQTATQYSLYDDAGTTVDHKAAVSDDATTFTRGEIATGP